MMRRELSLRVVVLSILCLMSTLLYRFTSAQENGTNVVVKVPFELLNGSPLGGVRVAVNGQIRTIRPFETAIFQLPVSRGELVSIELRFLDRALGGQEMQTWSDTISLNGSGHLEYAATPEGRGDSGQWPLVIFQAKTGKLDVFVNGQIKGTTEIARGIRPNQSNTFLWKKDTSDVCSLTATLPFNVQRTYRCDSVSRKVEER